MARAASRLWVLICRSGCAWRHLPPTFGTSSATAHRRITAWTEAGLRRRLHRAVLDELGARGAVTGPRRSSTQRRSRSIRARRPSPPTTWPGSAAA
ncbi:transposase [Streptomyces umbrinus]|uniref:transposase n=1 Tax=Streptomyces umbrinus TaxID=67370 RepID=UPI00359340F1